MQFEDTLPPGGSFSRTMEVYDFNIEVKYREYKPQSKGLIDWFKEVVRDEITIKDGKIWEKPKGIGVRG